jgi:aspartyl-tRNA(Asn)/glutamyl-tRNA(Gln) amidotransferase subunit C
MERTLSADDVRKVARLSRLTLTDAQVEDYRVRLAAVLTYVERLRGLDLDGVEPLAHIGEAVNRLDPDEPGPVLPAGTLERLAPRTWQGFIQVPMVLDQEPAP